MQPNSLPFQGSLKLSQNTNRTKFHPQLKCNISSRWQTTDIVISFMYRSPQPWRCENRNRLIATTDGFHVLKGLR